MLKLRPGEFQFVASTVYESTGIHLDPSKTYLVETRLGPLAQRLGLGSFRELALLVKGQPESPTMAQVVDAITTNETFFFRDNQPFKLLREILLPELCQRKRQDAAAIGAPPQPIRIWSAACSTGQELYSVAMLLSEELPALGNPPCQLLGTDISGAVVAQANSGLYNKFEIERGLSPQMRERYFAPEGNLWRVNDELRQMVSFRQLNLLKPLPDVGVWDIIFCRNVAIYFQMADRRVLFDKLADCLAPGGVLIIGSTEFLSGVSEKFEANHHMRSVYYTLTE